MDTCRILLAGRNRMLIDHIFIQLGSDFECMTTSMRPEDVLNHINAISYDVFIYCIQKEDRDDYQMIMGYKDNFLRKATTFIVAGHKEECDFFQKTTGHMAVSCYNIPVVIADMKAAIVKAGERHAAARAIFDVAAGGKKNAGASSAAAGTSSSSASAETSASTETSASAGSASGSDRKRILVIDDDPMVLKLVKGHLGETYDVASAISGKIAYKFLESKKVDLILLDYEMPEENGPQVYANIRKMEGEIRNVPIVFLSGIREREKLATALSLKPNGYLPKPINGPNLTATVSKFLD